MSYLPVLFRTSPTRLRGWCNNDSSDEISLSTERHRHGDAIPEDLLPVSWCDRTCNATKLQTANYWTVPGNHYPWWDWEARSCWCGCRFWRYVCNLSQCTSCSSNTNAIVYFGNDICMPCNLKLNFMGRRQKQHHEWLWWVDLHYYNTSCVFKTNETFSDTVSRSSFAVSLACRNSLARTSGSPACSTVDFDQDWPVCELRTSIDTTSLSTVVKIVGAVEVIL